MFIKEKRKIRKYGEFPNGYNSYEYYHCEICTEDGKLVTELIQCPECGRWVCRKCWNKTKGACKICSGNSSLSSKSSEFFLQKIKCLERKIDEVEGHIKNIDLKIGQIKFCPSCGASMLSEAKYCGICGKKLNSH